MSKSKDWELLSYIIQTNNINLVESQVLVIIDSLPSRLERLEDDNQKSAIVKLVHIVLKTGSPDMISKLFDVIPNLISACNRMLRDERDVNFILSLVDIVVSEYRTLISSSLSNIKSYCAKVLSHPIYRTMASTVLSSILSFDNVENWTKYWSNICLNLYNLMEKLGIKCDLSRIKDSGIESLEVIHSLSDTLTGQEKASACKSNFEGLCNLMIDMLRTGCSSGLVSLPLNVFLQVYQTVLSLSIQISPSEPKTFIEDDHHISPANLFSIATSLKLCLINVANELLDLHHPSIIQYGNQFYKPISTLISRKENQKIPDLMNTLLLCTMKSAKCFPTIVARGLSKHISFAETDLSGIDVIIQMFEIEMTALITETSVTQQYSHIQANFHSQEVTFTRRKSKKEGQLAAELDISDNNNELLASIDKSEQLLRNEIYNNGDRRIKNMSLDQIKEAAMYSKVTATGAKITLLFEACEIFLLCCGPMLPPMTRDKLELNIGRGLLCLCKGVMLPSQPDRRFRRLPKLEPIRLMPLIQVLLIRLATMDILSPRTDGVMSSNHSLLFRVCDICSTSAETSLEAMKARLVLDNILNPTQITLPITSVSSLVSRCIAAKQKDGPNQFEYINKYNQFLESQTEKRSRHAEFMNVTKKFKSNSDSIEDHHDSNGSAESNNAMRVDGSVIDESNGEVSSQSNDHKEGKLENIVNTYEQVDLLKPIQDNKHAVVKDTKPSADDDDDDLPDIV